MTTTICDNGCVGVLVRDEAGRYLMFRRLRPPAGIAPVAGHLDGHGSPEEAARAEVAEEVGLAVTKLTLALRQWRDNRCRRTPGHLGMGHMWWVYRAEVTGAVTTAPGETADAAWYSPDEIQTLADRTVAHAWGEVSAAEFAASPGLEPVWLQFFADLAVIKVDDGDLIRLNRLAA